MKPFSVSVVFAFGLLVACDNGLVRFPGDEPRVRTDSPEVEGVSDPVTPEPEAPAPIVQPVPEPVEPPVVPSEPDVPAPDVEESEETQQEAADEPPASDLPVPEGGEGDGADGDTSTEGDVSTPAPETPDAAPEQTPEPVSDPSPQPVVEDNVPETPEPRPDPAPEPFLPEPEPEPTFSYFPAGSLLAGSGTGSQDKTIYAPDMVFPIVGAPAYPQSMVWGYGGGVRGGDQCDARNYEYPWRDNFCEKRTSNFNTPTCPTPRVHLGQDIRVGTPAECEELRRREPRERTLHKVVAAEDGVISNIGSYTVTLRSGPRVYRYLHLNMRALQVSAGDTVKAGDHLGYVSNDFGGTPTTFHLHFEIRQNLPGTPWAFVPPYTSLVHSYARREGGAGREVELNLNVASAPLLPPEGFIIVE